MSTTTPPEPTSDTKGLPVNRIVAFLGPYIAIISGAVADWLLTHLNVGGLFHDRDQVSRVVAQLVVFIVTAGIVWLGQQKWLSGWIAYERPRP
jgi:hypothetical protein